MKKTCRKKILYAWDMGANWGHVGSFLAVWPTLQANGFACAAAIPDVRSFGARLAGHEVEVFAAPRSEPRRLTEHPASLAHILINRGYGNAEELLGMVLAWRSLLKAVKPAVVLIDAAPAALMAAESLGLPSLLLTVPFFIPPDGGLTPDFLPEREQATLIHRQRLCAQITHAINAVRKYFNLPESGELSCLYQATDRSLLTFAELDPHYPRTKFSSYRGALWNMGAGQPFTWPKGDGPRVFVYLRVPAMAELVLSVLREKGWPVVAYCPELSPERQRLFHGSSINISPRPLAMAQVAAEAELAVNYAGHGVVSGLLWHGIPQLMLPYDAEKELNARCVVKLGAGIRPGMPLAAATISDSLQSLADASAYREAAKDFARRYAHLNQQSVVNSLLTSCRMLAGDISLA